MKKILNKNFRFIILGVIISLFIFSPLISHAQTNELMTNLIQNTPVLPQADLIGIIFNIIKYVLMFVGVVAVLIIIYGGFLWMTARGNDEQVNKAKKVLVNGLIGLIVILLSYAIVSFVVGPLINGGAGGGGQGGGGGGPPGLPRGANYLVVTSKYPQADETTARNMRIIVSFNQNLVEESVKLARPVTGDPTKTSCVDANNNPTWTVAIQNNANEFIDGSLEVVGNSLVFTSTGVCPEPLNQFQCQGTNGQACSQGLEENGCCGCFVAGSNYKITLIANRGAAFPGLKGTRRTGNTMYKDENWNFNVGDYIDAAAPEVSKNLPQGDNVARNVGIFIAFNKPVDLTTLKVVNPACKPGITECTKENCGTDNCLNYAVETLAEASIKIYRVENGNNIPIPGYFEKFSNKELVFRPSAFCPGPAQNCRCLPPEENIKIELDSTKIKGANCLSLNCDNDKCIWQFETSKSVDLDPPIVKRTFPINKAQEVDRLLELEAEFDDESHIDPISVNEDTFILWPSIVPTKIETDNDVSIFTPSRILEPQTNYSPVVYGGGTRNQGCVLDPSTVFGVKDLAGNTMVGNYRWDFKTSWLVNNGEPYIESVSPEEGPKGECVTVRGYNLGCSSVNCKTLLDQTSCEDQACQWIETSDPPRCDGSLEAQNKIWTNQSKVCLQTNNQGLAQFYMGDLGGAPQYASATVLSWQETNKPEKCSFDQCPRDCSTCSNDPTKCLDGNNKVCYFCSDTTANCEIQHPECWCPMPARYSPKNEIIVTVPDEAMNRQGQPGQVKIIPAY